LENAVQAQQSARRLNRLETLHAQKVPLTERYFRTHAVLGTREVNSIRARPGLIRGYTKSARYDVGERPLLARKIEPCAGSCLKYEESGHKFRHLILRKRFPICAFTCLF
jgi:hypothetical protein